jgi:glycosyltransferase involved in cell wall biosynthesis
MQKQNSMTVFNTEHLKSDRLRRVALLSLSPIADDPRVRRQGDALASAGWQVTAFGLSGSISKQPDWKIVTVDGASPKSVQAPEWRGLMAAHLIPGRIRNAFWLLLARLGPEHARRAYWKLKPSFRMMAELAGAESWDLVIANDWPALGAGQQIANAQGAALLYDTHEFASDEYSHRGLWRFFYRPFLLGFEGEGARQAGCVTCVSDGIADALQEVHTLASRPAVIRNMPMSFSHKPLPPGEMIRVLYHGIITPGRGLEATIASVALWPKDYALTIRGPGAADYLAVLQKLAIQHGVEKRVTFAPPVAMTDLVAAASTFDIGLFSMPGHSVQSRFVLPNKFFEYVAAGLALCVSDLQEMQRLVVQYDMGALITGDSPSDIAQAIGKLDRVALVRFKNNAAKAAQELCWEREREKFLALCDALVVPISVGDARLL